MEVVEMEIEKLKSSGTVSYQGSSTVSAAQPVQEASASDGVEDFKTDNQNTQTQEKEDEKQQGAQNKQLKSAVNEINRQMKNSEAIFGIHEKTNRVTIKIIDKSTKEVLKEYPPEQTLDMIAKVWEIAGILVDEKR
mgnify:CR=1 FL=1